MTSAGQATFGTELGALVTRELQTRVVPADGVTGVLNLTLSRTG